jgi:3-hydroxyisobutyrate dehydrogenase
MNNSMNEVPQPVVGWIGTGVMGRSMCGHLLRAGYPLRVYSRTAGKAAELITAGAVWCASPAEVANGADVVCSMVGFPSDVRAVYLGSHGALERMTSGTTLIDFTTSEPSLAVELAERARERGVEAIDAPVSGGDVGARNATLSIMLGGSESACSYWQKLFETLGKTIVHQGPPGSGQHTKMVNQTLIATNMIGVCEALLYAQRAGLDLERVMQSVGSGAAGSWSLSNLGPRIIANQFDPGFFVEHFVKDMGIVLQEARRMQLSLPGLALAQQLYVALQAQGGSRLGTHALQLALARLSGIDWIGRVPNRQ